MKRECGRQTREIFTEYLEKTLYADCIETLLNVAQQTLEALLKPRKTELFVVWKERLWRMEFCGSGTVEFVSAQQQAGLINMAIKGASSLWTREEESGCWNGAIVLSNGTLCWGCVFLAGIASNCVKAQRAMAEKVCGYLAVQLLPLLEKYNPRATALTLLKEDALVMLSNELKMPLTIALSAAQLLQGKLKGRDEQLYAQEYAEFFGYMEQNLYKAVRLSDNLLETGRLESGYAHPQPEWFDIEECVRNIVRDAMPYAQQEKIGLRFTSVLKEPLDVLSDPQYVARIVLNLLAGAMAASKEAEGASAVAVTLAVHGDTAAISVRDNGPGLPREDLCHVFEKFWQPASHSSSRHTGSGLGLYLSGLLTKALDARLTVDGMLQGACFTLHLPVCSSAFPAENTLHARPLAYTEDWQRRLRIEFADFLSSVK